MDAKTTHLLDAARLVLDTFDGGVTECSVDFEAMVKIDLQDAVEAMEVEDDNEPPSEDSIEA